jgi:putative membrane-bound dehydrogenase-like protein
MLFPLLVLTGLFLNNPAYPLEDSRPLQILFLGDEGHHRPADRFRDLQPVLARRGIQLTYSDDAGDLNPRALTGYDGLMIYANTTRISPEQEKALLDYVEQGHGFLPMHCASYCFLNSPKYTALVGAQFLKHGTGIVHTTVAASDHPILRGLKPFSSWDETYTHTKHNEKDRVVLEYREENGVKEPWTWVRTQGKGRVFYTAWGHDQRTWSNPGFQALVERGIRWSTGGDPTLVSNDPAKVTVNPFQRPFAIPEMTPRRKDVKPFEYVDVGKKIPNYTVGRTWGVQGEPFNMMQKPLPPDESLKHMVVPKGFHVQLFASEADFGGGKPICMNWDERGRLWVGLTYDYPNELQEGPGRGHDRIMICEDTDGDGKADKFTVFADKLSIPSSLTFSKGGVIVFESRQAVWLGDTDGDDKADTRKVLFGTWSMRDTHGGASNMQPGLDNWIWGMQGYNPSRLTVGGETVQFRQGFYRFKPDGSKMEFIRSTDNNTWGFGMSEEGIIFGSTANRDPSVYMPIPNRYYEAVRGWTPTLVLQMISDTYLFKPITDKVRQVDQHGGYTAAAGHALYTARNYPQEYWNRTAFVNEPTGHLVGTFVLRSEGSNFRSNNSFNLLASDDEWTSPVMAEIGPDGNVWMIDWYSFIVQHNPTPAGFKTGKGAAYETDLRDKQHGRIYRILYDDNGPEQNRLNQFTLANATPDKLVKTLTNNNLFWRRHAQRLLVERGSQDVLPALYALVGDSKVDPIGLNVGAIHALWTIRGLGALDGKNPEATQVAVRALKHPSAGVRRNAVQVLPNNAASVTALLDAGLVNDADAQVRLMALLALADRPASAAAGGTVLAALANPLDSKDRWITDAATCAAAKNSEYFLEALAGRKSPAQRLLTVATIVADHYARGGPRDSIAAVIGKLTQADPKVAEAVIRGLATSWPAQSNPTLDADLEQNLERLLKQLPPERRGLLIKLAMGWGSKRFERHAAEAAVSLLARVKNETVPVAERIAAARELVGNQLNETTPVKGLMELISPRMSPELTAGILAAVRFSEAPATGEVLISKLPVLTPAARAAAISNLLGRPAWTRELIEAAQAGKVQLSELPLDQKQILLEHPDRTVRRRASDILARGGGVPNPDRQKVLDEMMVITKSKGDAAAGKLVFKNQCSKCHIHGGEGNRIGPDLTGMAVHPKEHLLADILDPSRSVEGNFRAYTVSTKSGRFLTGILAGESRTAIELFDAEGKKQTVLRDEIDELVATPKSLMPEGFEKQISRKDFTDLLEFLTQRGKYLPLPLTKVATVVSTHGMFNDENSTGERLVFPDWTPKTFQGVPFQLIDPEGGRHPNAILLNGPLGKIPPRMPKKVTLPVNLPARAVHLLSGVSGWGFPLGEKGTVSMIVRLHYANGKTEDHALKNGVDFADYNQRVNVPGSQLAFTLRGKQLRYLAIHPEQATPISSIEFVKGADETAPVVMAVTIETRD